MILSKNQIFKNCVSATLENLESIREQRVLKVLHLAKPPGRLVKIQIADLTPSLSDPPGSGWGLRICIPNQFPAGADAAGPATRL